MRGFTSIEKNKLNMVLADILIKEREDSCLIDGCSTNYIGEGLYYPIYGDKQFLVLKDDC